MTAHSAIALTCALLLLLAAWSHDARTLHVAQTRRGGTLVVAATDPGHFNPGLTTGAGTHLVAGNIYNGLVPFNAQLQPVPSLDERWFTFEQILLRFRSRAQAGLERAHLQMKRGRLKLTTRLK